MVAFGDMMRKQIVMPAHLMDDREHQAKHGRNLFKDFSSVAQATGTYTGHVRARLFWPPSQTVLGRDSGPVRDDVYAVGSSMGVSPLLDGVVCANDAAAHAAVLA